MRRMRSIALALQETSNDRERWLIVRLHYFVLKHTLCATLECEQDAQLAMGIIQLPAGLTYP